MFYGRFSTDVVCREKICDLIIRIAQKYKDNQRQNDFIIDLLQLDVPDLLQIYTNSTVENQICNHFSDFLHSFFRRNGLGYNVLARVRNVQVNY